jgi:hypothetical protein
MTAAAYILAAASERIPPAAIWAAPAVRATARVECRTGKVIRAVLAAAAAMETL